LLGTHSVPTLMHRLQGVLRLQGSRLSGIVFID